MNERPKLIIKKPLSLNKQKEIDTALQMARKEEDLKKKEQAIQAQALLEKEQKRRKWQTVNEIMAWLCETFPQCFNLENPKPLKCGIEKDLYDKIPLDDPRFSKKYLRFGLSMYVGRTHYLKTLQQDSHRYDLEGNPVQEIVQEHRIQAQERLDKRKQEKALRPKWPKKPKRQSEESLSQENLEEVQEVEKTVENVDIEKVLENTKV